MHAWNVSGSPAAMGDTAAGAWPRGIPRGRGCSAGPPGATASPPRAAAPCRSVPVARVPRRSSPTAWRAWARRRWPPRLRRPAHMAGARRRRNPAVSSPRRARR
jgi:hypothetical protein